MADDDIIPSSDEGSDYIWREQLVPIANKMITATITSEAKDANVWLDQLHITNASKPFRLIVGLDVKFGPPEPPSSPTSDPPYAPAALLVLCTYRSCLIFELTYARHDKIPDSLAQFLSNEDNTFVGVGMLDKLMQLTDEYDIAGPTPYLDLGHHTAETYNRPELRDAGVTELRTFLHGSDVERPWPPVVGDWDAEDLSNEQVRQACIDAFVCYELGSYLVFPVRKRTTAARN